MLMKEKPEISVKPCMDLIANHIDFFTPVKVEAFCKLLMEDNKLIDNIEKVVVKNECNPEIFKTAYAFLLPLFYTDLRVVAKDMQWKD